MGTPFQKGEIVAGKYRVERTIGEGGMGVVVAATRVALGDQVAVKFLRRELAKNPERVARFMREAQAAVKIRSEHVARIIDVGTVEGTPYIVMDLLEGEDLAQRIARGPVPVAEAVELLLQACDAVAAAHRAHIIHRDLKPANLFLTRKPNGDPAIKVLDFGISKFTEEGVANGVVTRTSAMLGSPTYMSPEQLRSSRDVDERSDVWSLGVIAYELLAGRPPFDFPNVPELCSAILTAQAPSIRAARPGVPSALDAVIARCLERSPRRRYASVDDLALALRAAAPVAQTALGTAPRAIITHPTSDRPLPDLAEVACARTDLVEGGIPPTLHSAAGPSDDGPVCDPHVTIDTEAECEPHVTLDVEPEAPISLVRLAPVGSSSRRGAAAVGLADARDAAPPRGTAGSASPRSPAVVRGSRDRTPDGPSRIPVSLGSTLAWPPPTHGGRMVVAFVVGAVAVVVAVSAVVAVQMGWQPPFP